MNQRIRYVKTNVKNTLSSARTFDIMGKDFKILLDVNKLTFKIVDCVNETVLSEGSSNDLNVLKRKVKEVLISLGVSFETESRVGKKISSESQSLSSFSVSAKS